jgi:hypothetical protein
MNLRTRVGRIANASYEPIEGRFGGPWDTIVAWSPDVR